MLNVGENQIRKKPVIMITFQEEGQNGGPYVSHKRIMESDLKYEYEFVPLIVPRFRKLIKPSNAKRFIDNIKQVKPDIIHFAGLQLEGFHVLMLAKLASCGKTICAIHGSVKDMISYNLVIKYVITILEILTLKHTDACYAVSRFVADWNIVKKYAKKSFGHIYNFFDFTEEPNRNTKLSKYRAEFGFSEDDVVIISTGRITEEKGFGTLLNVIFCFQRDKNIKFLIVGEGDYRKEMEQRIKEKRMLDKVYFTGYRKDVSGLLDASDIFVLCTYHETLGNSVIEASYHQLPVVASNTGGIPEIVNHGETGFLTEIKHVDQIENYLRKLVNDANLRTEMGYKGRKNIEAKFEKTFIEKELSNLYHTILNS